MTVREALCRATDQLKKAGVPDARLDAEYLLAEILRLDRLRLIADGGSLLTDEQLNAYEQWPAGSGASHCSISWEISPSWALC